MGNDISAFAAQMQASSPGMQPPPFFPSADAQQHFAAFSQFWSSLQTPASSSTRSSGTSSGSAEPNTATSSGERASHSATRNSSASLYKSDSERLDAQLDKIHTEEFFDTERGQNLPAKTLREYFAKAGIDRDSGGSKFVEVSDMRAAYLQRATLGVVELRRRLKARGISCDTFVERQEFEDALSKSSRLCPICIEHYQIGDRICVLPCGHTYHIECVRQAAHTELELHQRWPRCPECRNDLNKTPSRLSTGECPKKARRS